MNKPYFDASDIETVREGGFGVAKIHEVSDREIAVVTRVESGKYILIFVERAWVDYWSGLASLSKKIGHKVMKQQMEHLLKNHGICGS